ncbi:MAG: putative Na+/H+ antiporter [Bdellovibrionia bacterium]
MLETGATLIFGLAILHTFSVSWFQRAAARYPEGSFLENALHLLGEVEAVFGLWAGVFLIFYASQRGHTEAFTYFESLSFTEPAFVAAVMIVSSTRPVLWVVERIMKAASKAVPGPRAVAYFSTVMVLGPLLGSFITEPAAMTVSALLLRDAFFGGPVSRRFQHGALGLLFVNISIGGTLTHFAAPPVVMVARTWNWSTQFMATTFGFRAALAVAASTIIFVLIFKNELTKCKTAGPSARAEPPVWLSLAHFAALIAIVFSSHHLQAFAGITLLFIGMANVTKEHQDEIKFRPALLVGLFLGGLVILGGPQKWWLEPLLVGRGETQLYFGAAALTAILDNAAITYLASRVPDLSDLAKYAVVAGSVTGGGLTVIANAPNPAGYSLLNEKFGVSGISALGLLAGALPPTFLAIVFFWLI